MTQASCEHATRFCRIRRSARATPTTRGFALAEILVAILILALLAAVVVPTIFGRLAAARADAIVGELQSLQNGIMLFYRDVGRYPRRLDYLNVLPTPASSALDACGTQLTPQAQANFRGPYINRGIVMINPAGGITKYLLATGDSVESLISRSTITTQTNGVQQVLQILVYGPDQSTAETIDKNVDGNIDPNGGIIQYVAVTPYIVKWTIPIRLNAC